MQWTKTSICLKKQDAPQYLLYGFHAQGSYIIPPHHQPKSFAGDTLLWLLPASGNGAAYQIHTNRYQIRRRHGQTQIILQDGYTRQEYPARPPCDFFGKKLQLRFQNGPVLERTYAHFYWDHLLLQIAERTFLRKKRDIREGYVLSTLNPRAYAGTYPAVDHEFHMKGRYAIGGEAEKQLIRRMLELQLKIMREDKRGQSRNVCAIQPNRKREYNVWRRSEDRSCRAQMFRITANIEFVEGIYQYYCMTKDRAFLQRHIKAVEHSCSYIERFITEDDLLQSHVYYEDQVIKDGCVAQAQCFAVNSFRLMARLEQLLGRHTQAQHYTNVATRLGDAVSRDFPAGYWNPKEKRFLDWIDAAGKAHDHVHLLANELPLLFGLASEQQAAHCMDTLQRHKTVFQKFPSFVSAKLADYTPSEIGVGGPYDLCAAGRYWCWDAEFHAAQHDHAALKTQLLQVARQAESEGYCMGERYDMNYIYYNTGEDATRVWHGASLYYEYPNVFIYVLICKYLGVSFGFDCDVIVAPLLAGPGSVSLEAYGISYCIADVFTMQNITDRPLDISLPLWQERIRLAPQETYTQALSL